MRVAVFIVLVLLAGNCKKGQEDEQPLDDGSLTSTPIAETGYKLEISGVTKNINAGAILNLSVQIKKDGRELSDAAFEVLLQIVCDTHQYDVKQAVDAKGIADFDAFTLDHSWNGNCTATATASVAGQALRESTTFTIAAAVMLELVAGQGHAASLFKDSNDAIYNGFLSLEACGDSKLLAVTDDSSTVMTADHNGLAISSDNASWQYIVIGVPPAGCKLMVAEVSEGERHAIGNITVAPAGNNVAQGKITAVRKKDGKVAVVTEQVNDGTLYVYKKASNTWQRVDSVTWGGETKTTVNWYPAASYNRALLKLTQNGQHWWYAVAVSITIGEVKAGIGGSKMFSIFDAGLEKVKVQMQTSCGLKVYYLTVVKPRGQFAKASLQPITTTATELTPNNNGEIKDFFATGKPTASCKFSLKVGDTIAVATATIAHDYPIINVHKTSNNTLGLSSNARGVARPLYTSLNGMRNFILTAHNWTLHAQTVISAKKWNNEAAHLNQALAIHNGNEVFYATGR